MRIISRVVGLKDVDLGFIQLVCMLILKNIQILCPKG